MHFQSIIIFKENEFQFNFSISFTIVVVIVAVKNIRLKLKWIAYVSNQLGLQYSVLFISNQL